LWLFIFPTTTATANATANATATATATTRSMLWRFVDQANSSAVQSKLA